MADETSHSGVVCIVGNCAYPMLVFAWNWGLALRMISRASPRAGLNMLGSLSRSFLPLRWPFTSQCSTRNRTLSCR